MIVPQSMKQTAVLHPITWDHISSPSNEELVQIIRDVSLSPIDAELLIHGDQGPQCIVREKYSIIILHVPVRDKKTHSIESHLVRIVAEKDHVITIASHSVPALQDFFADCAAHPEKHEQLGSSALAVSFSIIDRINIAMNKKVHALLRRIEIAEDAIFHGNERKMVEEIALLSRDVLDFHRIALPQKGLFQALHRHYAFTPQEQELISRAYHQSEQLWNILQVMHSSMQELRNTNDSLLQHQENELLRMIFSYSILTVPMLALITEFNPHRVGATLFDTIAYWTIVAFLIILLIAIFGRARRKRVL